ARTTMVGGAIWGYCATGSWVSETRPTTTMTIETTAAKMGRSTKKCPNFMPCPGSLRCAAGGFAAGGFAAGGILPHFPLGRVRDDLATGPRPHQALDDDGVVG